jgi:flavin-dependent dehydrogenase
MAWETRLPGTALGLSRKMLDAALAERARQAGVIVREAETVASLAGDLKDGFELEVAGRNHTETVYARAVVGAHGKRGALDRALGRRFLAKRQPFLAIKAHFNGPAIPGRIELHAFPGGYCGMSEIEGGEKVVCLLAHQGVFQEVGGRGPEAVERFIAWMKTQNLYLRSWLQWAERIHERWITIAQVPFLPKLALERDVLMAGDSAGLIVPLAGNGIAMALEGGILAADFLTRFFLGEIQANDLRGEYPRAWRKHFSLRLHLGRALQPLLLHPRGASLALKLVDTFPVVGRLLVERTRSPVYSELEKNASWGEKNF